MTRIRGLFLGSLRKSRAILMHINANSLQMLLVVALSGWGALKMLFLWLKPAFTTRTFFSSSLPSFSICSRQAVKPTVVVPSSSQWKAGAGMGLWSIACTALGSGAFWERYIMRDTLGKRLDAATYGCDIVVILRPQEELKNHLPCWQWQKVKVKVAQPRPTLCHPMDYAIQEILQPEYWSG